MSHSFIAVANIVNGVDLDTFPAGFELPTSSTSL